jgi:hypothetical protein
MLFAAQVSIVDVRSAEALDFYCGVDYCCWPGFPYPRLHLHKATFRFCGLNDRCPVKEEETANHHCFVGTVPRPGS